MLPVVASPRFSGVYKFKFSPKTPYAETHPFIKDWNPIQKRDLESHIESGVCDWVLGNMVQADTGSIGLHPRLTKPLPYEAVTIVSPFNGGSYLLVDDQYGPDATNFRTGADRREAEQALSNIRDLPDEWIDRQQTYLEQKAENRPTLEIQYDVDIPADPSLDSTQQEDWYRTWKQLLHSIQIKGWELIGNPPVRMPRRSFTDSHNIPLAKPEMVDPA